MSMSVDWSDRKMVSSKSMRRGGLGRKPEKTSQRRPYDQVSHIESCESVSDNSGNNASYLTQTLPCPYLCLRTTPDILTELNIPPATIEGNA